MNNGRLIIHDDQDGLLRLVDGKVWEIVVTESEFDEIKTRYIVGSRSGNGAGIKVRLIGDDLPENDAKPVSPTLEDAYLYLINSKKGTPVNG